MRYNEKSTIQKQAPKPRHYPSKLITQLMNSDSDQQPQHKNLFNDKKLVLKQDIDMESQIDITRTNKTATTITTNKTRGNQFKNNAFGEYDSLQQMPPLMTISNQSQNQYQNRNHNHNQNQNMNHHQRAMKDQKQNIGIESNYSEMKNIYKKNIYPKQNKQNNKQIRYSCYKIQGNKMFDIGLYNSLSLQDTSAIKDPNQHSQLQLNQKLKQQNMQLSQKLSSFQEQNHHLLQKYQKCETECLQRIEMCERLEEMLEAKQKQIVGLGVRIKGLEQELGNLKIKMGEGTKMGINGKGNPRVSELSKYLVQGVRSKYHTGESNRDIDRDDRDKAEESSFKNKGDVDSVYEDVTQYIVNRVEELKSKLITNRMSKAVEQIIQEFMAEIVNINPITVSRTCSKIRSVTPSRSYRNINNQSWLGNRSTLIQKQTITPIKKEPPKQKSQDLRNLQKSLQKLREMQRSYCSNNSIINSLGPGNNSSQISSSNIGNGHGHYQNNGQHNGHHYTKSLNSYINVNGVKESYNSLERSCSGVDVSRSKSRRKRIFQ